ncbi:MAG: hypothetical protein GY749_39610 [Desulfobacteraceae bacterium]|nr:hypothetical protein [Desulfobacteraceae bacterium]
MFFYLGWLERPSEKTGNIPDSHQIEKITQFMLGATQEYDNLVTLNSYIPNMKYCCAALAFDFCPKIPVILAQTN